MNIYIIIHEYGFDFDTNEVDVYPFQNKVDAEKKLKELSADVESQYEDRDFLSHKVEPYGETFYDEFSGKHDNLTIREEELR